MSKFYIGTAGWSYNDWVPSFYPKKQSGQFDWLQYYATYFNFVEVNASYYAYLSNRVVEGWIKKLDDIEDFIFSIKLHQDFTHKRSFTNENINAFKYNLNILSKNGRLGGILIQFPYSFNYEDSNLQYIRNLINIFNDYKCFIEVRHASWNNAEVIKYFQESKITLCTIDQPQIGKSLSFDPIITGDTAYIRFHGRNYNAWFKSIRNNEAKQTYEQQSERYKYLYSPGELIEIDRKIKEIQQKAKEIFIIMNNHPTGYAVANAFEFIHLLEEKNKVVIPPNCVESFPRLGQII